jgi:UDP-N-acetylmuramate dehydrogenase
MNNLTLDYNLSKNSWFGLGGNAKKYFAPRNENELINFIKINIDEKYIPIGSGSNILFRDKGCLETIIKLHNDFKKTKIENDKLYCGAGVLKNQISKFALDNNISNFEFLSCIPGTMGGGVAMNAGCFGYEFKDILSHISGINKLGEKIVLKKQNIKFDYRQSHLPNDFIITQIALNITYGTKDKIQKKIAELKKRKLNAQPSKIKTGGSTFKNPENTIKAWELIKKSGCDKIKFGGVKFSDLHCNFIENQGSSAKDVEDLINYTIEQVKKKFNIILEPEIKIIGEKK